MIRRRLANHKRRIQRRLNPTDVRGCAQPVPRPRYVSQSAAQTRPRPIEAEPVGDHSCLPCRRLVYSGPFS
jgi:hypothetical protein